MSGFVYFLSDGNGGIKIGYTADIAARIRQLSVAVKTQLILLGSVPGLRLHERHLHQLLDRYRLNGEWFRDTPEVRGVVAETIKNGAPSLDFPLPRERAVDPYLAETRRRVSWLIRNHMALNHLTRRSVAAAELGEELGIGVTVERIDRGKARVVSPETYDIVLRAYADALREQVAEANRRLADIQTELNKPTTEQLLEACAHLRRADALMHGGLGDARNTGEATRRTLT